MQAAHLAGKLVEEASFAEMGKYNLEFASNCTIIREFPRFFFQRLACMALCA